MWDFMWYQLDYIFIIISNNNMLLIQYGGEGGIRTRGTVSPYTRFPGERLQPLSHLSEF